jgi:hypothetical protein
MVPTNKYTRILMQHQKIFMSLSSTQRKNLLIPIENIFSQSSLWKVSFLKSFHAPLLWKVGLKRGFYTNAVTSCVCFVQELILTVCYLPN